MQIGTLKSGYFIDVIVWDNVMGSDFGLSLVILSHNFNHENDEQFADKGQNQIVEKTA